MFFVIVFIREIVLYYSYTFIYIYYSYTKHTLVCNCYMCIKTKNQFYCFGIPEFLASESIIFNQKNFTVFNDKIISLKINQQGNF